MSIQASAEQAPNKSLTGARPRPLSTLSEAFFTEKVRRVDGKLLKLNDEVVPNLPISRDQVEKELSVFVDWDGDRPDMRLLGLRAHGRVMYFNLRFADRYGNIYDYVSLKGAGMPRGSRKGSIHSKPIGRDCLNGAMGLQEYWGAIASWDASNRMLEKGIETTVPIAIIGLEDVVMEKGEVKSVEDLKRSKVIPDIIYYADSGFTKYTYTPVIFLTGFPEEAMRVVDAEFEDFEMFAGERGMGGLKEYARWWSRRLANNLAKLHDLGIAHDGLTVHNVTLAGIFMDNDTVCDATKENKKIVGDFIDVERVSRDFAERVMVDVDSHRKEFIKTYLANRRNRMEDEEINIIQKRLGELGEDGDLASPEAINRIRKTFRIN